MPAIYISALDEDREYLNKLTSKHGVTGAALIRSLLRRHGEAVAAELGRLNKQLRGAVDGKVRP